MNWEIAKLAALLALSGLGANQLFAQKAAHEASNPQRHFAFYKEATSFDLAHKDLTTCASLARDVISFNEMLGGSGGLLAGAIEGLMASKDRKDMRAALMRRCMFLHGYDRYAMAAAEWLNVVGPGDMAVSPVKSENGNGLNVGALKSFAEIASGRKPQGERLDP